MAFIEGDAGMTSRLVKIGDFARVISGATPKTGIDEYWDGDIFWATPKDLSKFEGKYIGSTIDKITEAGCKSCSTVILPPNSVLLSSRAPIGHLAINSVPMATNQGFKSLILNPSLADSSYIFYWLRSNREFLNSLGRGATFKEISKSIVQEIEIPLPPLEVQKRIASILDAADALRAKRRESLRKLEVLLKSVFLEMFGDPVTNPKGWDNAQLSEVVAENRIVTYGIVQAGPDVPEGVPYIKTGDIKNGEIQTSGLSRTSFEIAESYKRSEVETGDIVMSIRATVGTTAVVPRELNGANLTQGTARISPGPRVCQSFLLWQIRSHSVQAWIQNNVKGATFREITLGRLREMPLFVPPLEIQHEFETRVLKINQMLKDSVDSLASLETLFSSLQDQAFNGTLDSAAPQLAQLEVQTSLF
jgi:type I restriction enzyme, S subunit